MTVRVRFAPSPTGHLHIGGLRSALFNWLFARHNEGVFLLRIEDTDRERSLPEYTQSILGTFSWCDLLPDEPIVTQSERMAEHIAVAERLLAQGKAYRCYCTAAELQARLGESAAEGKGYVQYDERCRNLTEVRDVPYVIRFKTPRGGTGSTGSGSAESGNGGADSAESVVVDDLIRGKIAFPLNTIDDFIIVRSDGSPMYNFVVVVDDAFMRITHIIRGEEHLVNTPRQMLLYQACGFEMPKFAHVPLILGPTGSKLSKRDAAVSVLEYKQAGFLADALCNYLVRLGWSHGDQEIFSRDEMVSYFDLPAIGKTGAIFDTVKLLWLNGMYIKQATAEALLALLLRDVAPDFLGRVSNFTQQQILALITLYKDRVKTLVELQQALEQIHAVPDQLALVKEHPYIATMTETQWQALDLLARSLSESEYSRDALVAVIAKVSSATGLKMPDIAQPVRLALTGSLAAPGVYELLLAFGMQSADRLRGMHGLRSV